jgi:hypothetical protein
LIIIKGSSMLFGGSSIIIKGSLILFEEASNIYEDPWSYPKKPPIFMRILDVFFKSSCLVQDLVYFIHEFLLIPNINFKLNQLNVICQFWKQYKKFTTSHIT